MEFTQEELSGIIKAIEASDLPADLQKSILDKLVGRHCPACGAAVGGRATYCSNACKQKEWRRREFEARRRALIPKQYR